MDCVRGYILYPNAPFQIKIVVYKLSLSNFLLPNSDFVGAMGGGGWQLYVHTCIRGGSASYHTLKLVTYY